MAENKPDLNVFKDKSAVSVAIATLILLLLSFGAFRLFSNNPAGNLNGNGAEDVIVEESTNEESDESSESSEDSEQASSEQTEQGEVSGTTSEEEYGVGGANPEEFAASAWAPNNYNQGDLEGDTYTVKAGDTLWEIAEGFTGNGNNWAQIAQANNVQYNASGYPLIFAGQTIAIPSFN